MNVARMGALAAFLVAPALTVRVAVAEPDAATVAPAIAGSKWVRVTVPNGSFELLRPSVEEDGLHFRKVRGYPITHPGRMAAKRPPAEPPASPLPWEAIERIDRPVKRFSLTTPAGGIAGLLTGAVMGLCLGVGVAYTTGSGLAGAVTWVSGGVAGTIIGANAASKEWRQVYPEASLSTVPDSRRR